MFRVTITAMLRHGASVYAQSQVLTFEGKGVREATYAEVAQREQGEAQPDEEAHGDEEQQQGRPHVEPLGDAEEGDHLGVVDAHHLDPGAPGRVPGHVRPDHHAAAQPQTPVELFTRTERLARFAELADLGYTDIWSAEFMMSKLL